MKRKITYTFIYIILTIAAFVSVFPFYWMIVGSTNQSIDVNKGKLTFGTHFLTNFKNLVNNYNLGEVLWNSFQVSFL